MKRLLSCMALLLIMPHSSAQVPEGETVVSFTLNELVRTEGATSYLLASSPNNQHVKIGVDDPSDPNNDLSAPLAIVYDGAGTLQLRWLSWTQGSSHLVTSPGTGLLITHHFAIMGEIATENVSPGSYLEMQSTFASPRPGYPKETATSRATEKEGPMAHLDGNSDWRKFWVPYDATQMKTNFEHVEMYIHLTGSGTVRLRNLKLVQYPDDPDAASEPSGTSQPQVSVSAAVQTVKTEELVINISSSADGTTYFADGIDYANIGALQQMLDTKKKANSQINVVLRADKTVPYNDIVGVLDAVRRAQFPMASFATLPAGDPPTATATPRKSFAIDLKSFALGVVMSLGVAAAVSAFRMLARLWQKRRADKEMRRIASLDT